MPEFKSLRTRWTWGLGSVLVALAAIALYALHHREMATASSSARARSEAIVRSTSAWVDGDAQQRNAESDGDPVQQPIDRRHHRRSREHRRQKRKQRQQYQAKLTIDQQQKNHHEQALFSTCSHDDPTTNFLTSFLTALLRSRAATTFKASTHRLNP